MSGQKLRASVTLDQAITANKSLLASAKRYRNDAETYPIGHSHKAILIQRARDCEAVAAALISNADVS